MNQKTMENSIITPLYKREQWPRWQKLFKGTQGAMLWTFDEWLKNSGKMVQEFKIKGNVVHQVELDIDEFSAWIQKTGLPLDGNVRNTFASFILNERMKAAGDFKG